MREETFPSCPEMFCPASHHSLFHKKWGNIQIEKPCVADVYATDRNPCFQLHQDRRPATDRVDRTSKHVVSGWATGHHFLDS